MNSVEILRKATVLVPAVWFLWGLVQSSEWHLSVAYAPSRRTQALRTCLPPAWLATFLALAVFAWVANQTSISQVRFHPRAPWALLGLWAIAASMWALSAAMAARAARPIIDAHARLAAEQGLELILEPPPYFAPPSGRKISMRAQLKAPDGTILGIVRRARTTTFDSPRYYVAACPTAFAGSGQWVREKLSSDQPEPLRAATAELGAMADVALGEVLEARMGDGWLTLFTKKELEDNRSRLAVMQLCSVLAQKLSEK